MHEVECINEHHDSSSTSLLQLATKPLLSPRILRRPGCLLQYIPANHPRTRHNGIELKIPMRRLALLSALLPNNSQTSQALTWPRVPSRASGPSPDTSDNKVDSHINSSTYSSNEASTLTAHRTFLQAPTSSRVSPTYPECRPPFRRQ